MLSKLSNMKQLHFVTKYKANTILKCGDWDITGNIVGEHLMQIENLPLCDPNHSQWEYISNIYGIPYHSCISLLGCAQQNWVNYCCGFHPDLNILLSYWTKEGFKLIQGGPGDLEIHLSNVNHYLGYESKDQLDLIIRENLDSVKRANLKPYPRESLVVFNYK